jgi:hypothetical protein
MHCVYRLTERIVPFRLVVGTQMALEPYAGICVWHQFVTNGALDAAMQTLGEMKSTRRKFVCPFMHRSWLRPTTEGIQTFYVRAHVRVGVGACARKMCTVQNIVVVWTYLHCASQHACSNTPLPSCEGDSHISSAFDQVCAPWLWRGRPRGHVIFW